MKKFIKRMAMAGFALVVIVAIMTVGYGSRRQTPPAEVDLETADLDIDFGDEFIPLGVDDDLDIGG